MGSSPINLPSLKQQKKTTNGEVHNWYHIALGYSDTLVSYILKHFKVNQKDIVLDPFCGSGTTIVECKKHGIKAVGVDANPSSVFAAKVKTNWRISSKDLLIDLEKIESSYQLILESSWDFKDDKTYKYLYSHGMIKRGWISDIPLYKCICLKHAIISSQIDNNISKVFLLALIDDVVYSASNVKFGPQLYCGKPKVEAEVLTEFKERIKKIASDLVIIANRRYVNSAILLGDARDMRKLEKPLGLSTYDYVICSPPYPGEHDYTRHSRLELAFLEEVVDKESLQRIKKNMIRSNTKGIYKEDNDKDLVINNTEISDIVKILSERIKEKKHGFARLYPTVVQEYFGGMKRHLLNLYPLLSDNAKCAYVLGDQFSYLQVPIPTAKLLSTIVEETGYVVDKIEPWKTSWSTKTSKKLDENILFFHKP